METQRGEATYQESHSQVRGWWLSPDQSEKGHKVAKIQMTAQAGCVGMVLRLAPGWGPGETQLGQEAGVGRAGTGRAGTWRCAGSLFGDLAGAGHEARRAGAALSQLL